MPSFDLSFVGCAKGDMKRKSAALNECSFVHPPHSFFRLIELSPKKKKKLGRNEAEAENIQDKNIF